MAIKAEPINSLRFEDVTFGYDVANPVFEGLTVDLPVGQNILISGDPGQGTSTFLKLLAVTQQPFSGRIIINGHDTSMMSFEEFLPLRMRIGYTFDYGGLFSNRSLLDNLTLPLLYHNVSSLEEARSRGIELANHFGFYKKLIERPSSVTGGLRKLVSVLRTLLMDPEMLVMDDPFMGVDHQSVVKLIEILNERREAHKIHHLFLTSQDPKWAQQLGCSSMHLHDGIFKLLEVA